ncbi:zinc-finger protein [Elysia marginata]|uniref:Zinc-finger protein n=1 Tax=Elysia marginata TaxID=1093978 RepID=A0AAV4JHL0_9GAST|nr:zinc-finger protein [Elysia marginata]
MESKQNLDGFEGLPLDTWIGLQQQAQPQISAAARSVFQGSSGYPQVTDSHLGREFLIQRNIPPPSSLGAPVEHFNFQQHQQFHQLPVSSHGHFDHGSQDRSAWSHLLSLGSSGASSSSLSGPSLAASHLQDPFPIGLMKDSTGFSGASTKFREHLPMHNPPANTAPLFPQGSLSQLPFQGLSQDKVSQHLNQLMNLSKSATTATKVPLSKPLTVSTEFSSLESSGDYSPVSPPVNPPAYEDSLLDLARQGKPLDLLGIEPSTSALPMTSTQLQGPLGRMNSHTGAMSTLPGYNLQRPLEGLPQMPFSALPMTQKPFASPSDMPLDMTTAVAGKSNFSQMDLGKQTHNFSTSLSTSDSKPVPLEKLEMGFQQDEQFCDLHSSSFVGVSKESTPSLHTALKTSDSNNASSFPSQLPVSTSASVLAVVSSLSEKNIKMPKSTPKKSNFYGRDASLFTFSDDTTTVAPVISTATSHAHSIAPNVAGNQLPEDIFCKEEVKSYIDSTQLVIESKDSHLLASVPTENDSLPSNSTSGGHKDIASVPDALPVSDVSDIFPPPISSVIPALDSSSENISDKAVSSGSVFEHTEELEDKKNIHVPKPSETLETENSPVQNSEVIQDVDPSPNILNIQTAPNWKVPKGRKRKGPGAGKRANKQTAKKPKIKPCLRPTPIVPQSMVVLERTNITPDIYDRNVQNDDFENELKGSRDTDQFTAPGKKTVAKKTRKNVKEDGDENAPRRSSSRKSKDNAMRLIELQADAGYVSLPGVDEEQLPKRMNRKRAASSTAAQTFQKDDSELSDLSDDSSSSENQKKDKDDDYVVDEEEAAAVEKDELVDEDQLSGKTFVSKKKTGSLRISIKLSGDSSAEIVSGIEDSPVKKKKKTGKKKALKSKSKADRTLENKDLAPKDIPSETTNEEQVEAHPNSNLSTSDVQTSLIEKYFSSASASKQNLVVKPRNTIGNNVGLNVSKKIVGKNKKLNQKKNRNLSRGDSSGTNPSKTQSGDTKDNLPKFRCGYCPQRYHTKSDLLTHMDEHMSEMESKGNDKDTTSETKSSSQPREKNLAQNNSTDKKQEVKPWEDKVSPKDKAAVPAIPKFKCGECEKMFKSKPLLLDHVRSHTADKPFECDMCHKCFTDRTLLSGHRKTHEQQNLLRCQLCSKAFIHKADLNHHMQSHPKRTAAISSLKISASKNSKKLGQQKPSEPEPQVTKKTSFASALSGDTDDSSMNSVVSDVLVLKRKETTVGHKTTSLKGNLSNAQGSSVNKVVKAAQKSVPVQPKKSVDNDKEKTFEKTVAGPVSEKPKPEAPSDVCTCKECPECVTRFLQSFM